MKDERKTKAQLLEEIRELKRRNSELEAMEREPHGDLAVLLSQREEVFRGIAENMVDMIHLTDDFGIIKFASESYQVVLGFKPKEVIGRTVLEFVHPDDLDQVLTAMRTAYLSKSNCKIIYRHRHADGGHIWLEVYGKVLIDRQGHVTGAVFGSRDITQRKDSEEEITQYRNQLEKLVNKRTFKLHQLNTALLKEIEAHKKSEEAQRASEERFRLIFENISSGILFTDFSGRIITANALARELLGISEAAEGKALKDFFSLSGDLLSREKLGQRHILKIIMPDGMSRYWGFTNVEISQPEAGLITIFNDVTEIFLAEREIQKLSQFQESIIDNADIWLTVVDERDRVVIWNRAAEKISGYSKEEVRTLEDAIKLLYPASAADPELIGTAALAYKSAIPGQDYEVVIHAKNGKEKIIVWNARSILDREGKFNFNVGIGWDITERKKMEEAVRKNEERFRLMIENASDVIGILNLDGTLRYLSPAFEKIFGFEISTALGQEPFQWVHPDDMNPIIEYLSKIMLQPNTPIHLNYRMRHRDGSWRYMDTIGINLLDHPEIQGFVVNSRDITDRKLAEEELKRREEKFRLMIDNLTDVITLVDAEGKITYESSNLKMVSGNRPEEVIDHDIFEYIHPEDLPGVIEVFMKGINNPQQAVTHNFRARNRTGEWRYVEATGVNLLNHPAIQGLVITSRDITERKKFEEEKERMQKQILRVRKLEALGTLAGGIAHDFNNILGAVIGFAELSLQDTPSHTLLYNNLTQILKAGNRAKDLVRQIHTFSSQDRKEKKPTRIDLLVKETLDLLRPSIPTKIFLQAKLGIKSGTALVDATQIHQVLMNLCTNAVYAMRDQGGTLEICLEDLDIAADNEGGGEDLSPGEYLKLTVRDTGPGIPQEIIERIFDPYFTTKKSGEGTGLGLAVVHGIVKRHNGIIKVETEPGQGSAFHIFLPRMDVELEQDQPVTRIVDLGREKILFVDDDQSLVLLWRQILKKLGYQVIGQTNSLQALELFQDKPHEFDLVITDQVMPDLTGMELARAMLALQPDLKIILCTGFSEGVDAEQAKKVGIKEFVFKPLTTEMMSRIIREVLNRVQ